MVDVGAESPRAPAGGWLDEDRVELVLSTQTTQSSLSLGFMPPFHHSAFDITLRLSLCIYPVMSYKSRAEGLKKFKFVVEVFHSKHDLQGPFEISRSWRHEAQARNMP